MMYYLGYVFGWALAKIRNGTKDVPDGNQAFLDKLVHLARTYGWDGDYAEVRDFVDWCSEELGLDKPTTEPYLDVENEEK